MNNFEKKALEKKLSNVGCLKLYFTNDLDNDFFKGRFSFIAYYQIEGFVFSSLCDQYGEIHDRSEFNYVLSILNDNLFKFISMKKKRLFNSFEYASLDSRDVKRLLNYIKGMIIHELKNYALVTSDKELYKHFSHFRFEQVIYSNVKELYLSDIKPIDIIKDILISYGFETKSFLGVDFFK